MIRSVLECFDQAKVTEKQVLEPIKGRVKLDQKFSLTVDRGVDVDIVPSKNS